MWRLKFRPMRSCVQMSRRLFFVGEVRRGIAAITGADAEHLVRVLRAEPGQVYEVSDNCDLYLAEITIARKSVVEFRILERLPPPPVAVLVRVAAALIKFDRFEWMIEKATELGVESMIPFEATRTEKGLLQAAAKRNVRWDKIVREASQQSRRARMPSIDGALKFSQILELPCRTRLFLDEHPRAKPILRALPAERSREDEVLLVIGPEGGWTDDERAQAHAAGLLSCSLGKTVLRAETAAVAAVAVIQAAWEG
jgi:16S rRNA (uracil1498-N3)-methyltransferase